VSDEIASSVSRALLGNAGEPGASGSERPSPPVPERHAPLPPAALDAYFGRHPEVRGYVVDERGTIRRHVAVFVGGEPITDREAQSDAVGADTEIHVMQALSGG